MLDTNYHSNCQINKKVYIYNTYEQISTNRENDYELQNAFWMQSARSKVQSS